MAFWLPARLVIGHLALRLVAFVQLFPRRLKGIAVAAPIIIVAAFAVPADIWVRGFRVMPDDKLLISDRAAFYDFIALIDSFFFVHRQSPFIKYEYCNVPFAYRPDYAELARQS